MQAYPDSHPSRSVLTRLLSHLTGLCARHAWATILLTVVTSIGCAYYAFGHLTFKTDRADLIHPKADFNERWIRYLKSFGTSNDIVIVVKGKRTEAIKDALDDIGARLANRQDLFKDVLYKVESGSLREKGLQYLPPDLLVSGLERIDAYRPILNGQWELIRLDGLITRLQNQLSRQKARPDLQQEILNHAELLTTSLLNTIQDRDDFTNPWPEILQFPEDMPGRQNQSDYLLNESGTMGFVLANAVHDHGTFEGPSAAIDLVRATRELCQRKHPEVRFLLTGISVLENDEMRRSMADSTTAWIISLLGVATLLLLGFRGFLHPMLGLLTLAVGIAWSFGYTSLVIGHLNILSVSFAAMLMGLGIDFSIHVISRYLELRHQGLELIPALIATSDSVGMGIMTGAVTTSLAFFCATLTDFLGVAELGIITGGGILLCALATLTILPALIAVTDRNRNVNALPKPFEARQLRELTHHHPWPVILASIAGLAGIGYQAFDWTGGFPKSKVVYDHNLLNLQANGLESVEAQKQIFQSSQHSLLHALSIADSPEAARELKARFESLGSVRQVQELATRIPSIPFTESNLLVQAFQSQLARLPAEPPGPTGVSPANTGIALEQLAASLKGRKDLVSKMIVQSIDRFLDRLDVMSTKEQTEFLSEFDYRLGASLLAQLKEIASASNPEPVTAEDLPDGLRDRFVSPEGQWLLQIYPKDQIWDMEPLERFVTDVRSVDPEATGTPLQNFEAGRQIKRSYEICAVYAFGTILITLLLKFSDQRFVLGTFAPAIIGIVIAGGLMYSEHLQFHPGMLVLILAGSSLVMSLLRDPQATGDSLLALMPPMIGMGLTCGLLVMLQIPLNPANLIILPLILGIGVDNGIHILHDFRAKPDQTYCMSPSTINAIILTSTTTMVGFGSLMISAHRGLYSLGAVLTIGVGACLFISLVFLPAILAAVTRHRKQETQPLITAPVEEVAVAFEPSPDIQPEFTQPVEVIDVATPPAPIVQEPIHVA